MADKRTRRAQKKREKQRKRRDQARKSRGSRSTGGTSLEAAAEWPVGECWVSDNWDQRGAQVLVAFSRVANTGLAAVAFFELDLAEDGVTEVTTFTKVTPDQIMGESGKRGGDRAMVASDPALAVKLVHTARGLSESAPSEFDTAIALFGDIRAEDCPDEILTGLEDTEEVEADGGMLHGVKRFFGLV